MEGAWTWADTDCTARRYEISPNEITAVLPTGERGVLYNIVNAYDRGEAGGEVVLDLKVLPQPGMSAEVLKFLEETGGLHTMTFKVDHDNIKALSMSVGGRTGKLGPGDATYEEFNLRRCPSGTLT